MSKLFLNDKQCQNTVCSRQGEVCKVKKQGETCQCMKRCLKAGPFVCGSNNAIYKSRCHLNLVACQTNRTISPVPCTNASIETLRSCSSDNGNTTHATSMLSGVYNVYMHENKSSTLYCNVVGEPQPAVHWIHDGVPVASGPSSNFETKDLSLTIKRGAEEFAGVYVCVAVNCDFRESSPQAVQSIHVKYVPSKTILRF